MKTACHSTLLKSYNISFISFIMLRFVPKKGTCSARLNSFSLKHTSPVKYFLRITPVRIETFGQIRPAKHTDLICV